MKRIYMVYDGRASSGNTDDALVLLTTDTLEKAVEALDAYADAVIVSYSDDGVQLSDERWEPTS